MTDETISEVFTEKQLEDWLRFELVRETGCVNMHDSMAFRATGLNGDEYRFVMDNYLKLKEQSSKT